MEILGGIAKLRVAAAELRAFSRWSNAFAEQRVASAARRRMTALQTIAATSLPILGTLGVFAIAAVAIIPSMSPPSPPSTAPSPSSPPPSSVCQRAQQLVEVGAAFRPRPPGVRGAARSRGQPRRSRRARRPRRRAQPVVSLRRGRAVDARGRRLRGAPGRERGHRRRLGLGQVDAAAPAARLRDAGARRRLLRRQGSRDARPAAGAPPDRHGAGDGRPRAGHDLREHRGQRAADARAGDGSGTAGRPRRRHRRHADGAGTARHGRRQPALGRTAPARDDRPRAGQAGRA